MSGSSMRRTLLSCSTTEHSPYQKSRQIIRCSRMRYFPISSRNKKGENVPALSHIGVFQHRGYVQAILPNI